jgi:hypothetical protein
MSLPVAASQTRAISFELKHHPDMVRWLVFARTIDLSSANESIT